MEASRMTFNIKKPITVLALAILAAGCQSAGEQKQRETIASNAQAGKALFEEKCKTVAGEKIYRTVPDVDGVLLMKVRPMRSERELADPMWPGAAFSRESGGDSYITTFLGYEYSSSPKGEPVTPKYRGYINTDKRPGGLAGYRFVDVINVSDGVRYRYRGRWEEPGLRDKSYLKGYIKFYLDKTLTSAPAPRYGVTYEDHVIPEERVVGVASSTVKVVDLKTNEVLGEMIRYAWRPRGVHATEWLTSSNCSDHAVGTNAATRKFVDQILIPNKEK
jgi:hypothetical protein